MFDPADPERPNTFATAHPFTLTEEITPARARRVGVIGGAWPYGPNIDHTSRVLMVRWAEARRLRISKARISVPWLKGKRLHWPEYAEWRTRRGDWFDHVTGWTFSGLPAVLVAQPYPFGKESEKDLAAIAEDPDLHVIVGPTGWYGRGTVFIEIWRRDMFEAAQAYLEYQPRASSGT